MSTPTERSLTTALRQIAGEAKPAHLPSDLWVRGRRRRRRRVVAGLVAAIATVAILALNMSLVVPERSVRPAQEQPAPEQPVIPTRISPPLPFTRTVQDAPNGPTSLIMDGVGSSELAGYEDHVLTVGTDGSYRILRSTNNNLFAGRDFLLSPDGRYVAADWNLEGADRFTPTAVVDLMTGQVNSFPTGPPLAWSPDGRLLVGLGRRINDRFANSEYVGLLDLSTGETEQLAALATIPQPDTVAFSPDGSHIAVHDGSLSIVDVATGAVREILPSSAHQRLAGKGAWRRDGRIALWQCAMPCPAPDDPFGPLMRLSLVLVEPGSGVIEPAGIDVSAQQAYLLGWQSDGDAVILLDNRDPFIGTLDFGVFAYHPSVGRTALVTLYDAGPVTRRVDIAQNLLDDVYFGASAPGFTARLADVVQTRRTQLIVITLLVAAAVAARVWWIRRQR